MLTSSGELGSLSTDVTARRLGSNPGQPLLGSAAWFSIFLPLSSMDLGKPHPSGDMSSQERKSPLQEQDNIDNVLLLRRSVSQRQNNKISKFSTHAHTPSCQLI